MGGVGARRDHGKADVVKEGPCKGWFSFLPEAHPTGTPRLHAFWPVEEGTAEMERVREKGIHHGQLCRVAYRAIRRGGRVMKKFVDIEPLT